MIVLAREVFLCACSTDVPAAAATADDGLSRELAFVRGGEDHLRLLDPEHHAPDQVNDMRARLARGETWLVGLLSSRIATYTWLHTRPACEYPYLPGCAFDLPADHGYGYDAWTTPSLRNAGLRRRAFVEELRWLQALGKRREASFFVSHQLAGATRSLALAGVHVVPLWRVVLRNDRGASFERLRDDAPGISPRASAR
jgi:hypothetical protein